MYLGLVTAKQGDFWTVSVIHTALYTHYCELVTKICV